jgi:hypothetical protein
MAKPETLHCDAGTELWHSLEIGMTDIRMAPIDAVLLAADACHQAALDNQSKMLD